MGKQNLFDYLKIGFKLLLIGILGAVINYVLQVVLVAVGIGGWTLFPETTIGGITFVTSMLLTIPISLIVSGYLFTRFKKWLWK